MALDVGIRKSAGHVPLQRELSAALEDDGYYWFMYPQFLALAKTTGEFIDLYGDARFTGKNITHLKAAITRIRARVLRRPKVWSIFLGIQTGPGKVRKRLYSRLSKVRFLELLAQLNAIATNATRTNRSVVFFGD